MKVLEATFVTSAIAAHDIPRHARPQVALVGRSNVGKSSLINALARSRVARTSAAPGKTRLANVYRVTLGGVRPVAAYLVDLPGYGYARGGDRTAREFARLTTEYFAVGRSQSHQTAPPEAALLMVDSRHPGLDSDLEAWRWLSRLPVRAAIVATKVDKLGRAERSRAIRGMQRSFDSPVLPVSAATGEGMDTLWKLIARLVSPHPSPETAP